MNSEMVSRGHFASFENVSIVNDGEYENKYNFYFLSKLSLRCALRAFKARKSP